MNEFYKKPEPLPECEDRQYWHKRFNFASWLFLFFGLFFVFNDQIWAAMLAITVSLGYRTIDTILDIRHLKWHIKHDEGEHTM